MTNDGRRGLRTVKRLLAEVLVPKFDSTNSYKFSTSFQTLWLSSGGPWLHDKLGNLDAAPEAAELGF